IYDTLCGWVISRGCTLRFVWYFIPSSHGGRSGKRSPAQAPCHHTPPVHHEASAHQRDPAPA
ncbi:hypothetical protein OWO93_28505, partial [Bacillus cereus]|uniref:hypothetical protein n=1 Tax=Bacillus cereus TaxID=1396 RepID=UPI00254E2E5E